MRILNTREVSTVLAGLRLLQQSLEDDPESKDCEPLTGFFEENNPLDGGEIDSLCEEFGLGRV